MPRPVRLGRRETGLVILWDDQLAVELPWQPLREACPCATCLQQDSAAVTVDLPILDLAEARPLTLSGIEPMGNYAFALMFSDGHSTGIYTIEYLRQLSEAVPEHLRLSADDLPGFPA